MGLDMYLYARDYVGTYYKPEHKPALDAVNFGFPAPVEAYYIQAEIMYWRKANQIHNWFVTNVQNGVDECQESYVAPGQLVDLRDLIAETINTKNAELLPPCVGFFFGSTEIDDWYWRELTDTLSKLNELIEHPNFEQFDYLYRSSW